MSFAALVARLDAEADTRLGDSLFYDIGGIQSAEPVQGFISDPGEIALEGSDTPLDAVGQRRRLKISRLFVEQPSGRDRIRSDHPLLAGATWKPEGPPRSVTGSRYWLLDLTRLAG